MTPEEKAKELVERYFWKAVQTREQAKRSAIIAVDEILQIVPSVYVTKDEEIHSGHYQYWKEVKQEIEKQ